MGNIGSDIANGAISAVWKALGLVPFGVWVVLMAALIVAVFILRYATNWKVDAVALFVLLIVSEVLVYRAHWIGMGRAEAQAQVKAALAQVEAYKKTNGLIIACYETSGQVWDRTQGKCLRTDGAR